MNSRNLYVYDPKTETMVPYYQDEPATFDYLVRADFSRLQYDANGVTIPNWTQNTAKVDSITIADHLNAYYLQFPSDASAFGTNAGTIQDQTRGGNLLYAGSGSTSGMTALEKYSKLSMLEVYYMPPNYHS